MIMDFESKLLNIRQETSDVKTFRFEVPESFSFLPGQYIMLEIALNGEKERRAFSISSSPTKKGFIEITKKIGDSEFSQKLDSLQKGFVAHVKGPYGVFVFNESHDAILLAGGIGITTFRSYIEYATDKHLNNKITLFYSNKTPEDIAFRDELQDAARKNKNISIIETITRQEGNHDWVGAVGRIDENMIRENADVEGAIFYICGPPAMVDAMVDTVKNIGIPKERIKLEKFVGY